MSNQSSAHERRAEPVYTEWREQMRDGLKPLQERSVPLYRDTTLFRVYSSTLVPGLLQTEGYATALLNSIGDFRELPIKDPAEAAAARVRRSRIIHEPGHRCVPLVEESVLYHQVCGAKAMAEQLDHLLAVEALPPVTFGVIPKSTPDRLHLPMETFHVFDDGLVSVELLSGRLRLTQPHEVTLYVKAFEKLRGMAVYGAEARALVEKAAEALR
ncbi:DUF5753 domain-containing protein [Streptomyces noursei]|uniref:DUF5753 domain-containing protein n=1 Tax=Streptomyces noursei TaxID=1971 RepID=UPI0033288691